MSYPVQQVGMNFGLPQNFSAGNLFSKFYFWGLYEMSLYSNMSGFPIFGLKELYENYPSKNSSYIQKLQTRNFHTL